MAVKKKKRGRKAISWSPPKYDPGRIGEFIQQRYGTLPGWRQKELYDRFKAQGAEFGEDPTGVRTDGLIALTPEMRNRLPEGWGGEGVQNIGFARPQYDETKFELGQSATGRYFLRPRTEFTGLSPEAIASIRQMDQQTAAQQSVIRAAFNGAADNMARDAQRISASISSVPTSTGSMAPSTAASTGSGVDASRQGAMDAQRAAAANNSAITETANVTGLRAQAENAAMAYAQQAAANRASTLAAYRNSAAEAAAAEDTNNTRLRGQDLSLLGQQIRAGAQINMNNADNATSIANTTQNNNRAVTVARTNAQVRIADINAKIAIAQRNNDTRTTIALLKERSRYMTNQNQIIRQTVNLVETADAAGNPVPVARRRKQFVQLLMAQGVPKNVAINAARSAFKVV